VHDFCSRKLLPRIKAKKLFFHNALKNFHDQTTKRNWTIIYNISLIAFLENGNNIGKLPFLRDMPTVKGALKIQVRGEKRGKARPTAQFLRILP
jgi:hypothetical protein